MFICLHYWRKATGKMFGKGMHRDNIGGPDDEFAPEVRTLHDTVQVNWFELSSLGPTCIHAVACLQCIGSYLSVNQSLIFVIHSS